MIPLCAAIMNSCVPLNWREYLSIERALGKRTAPPEPCTVLPKPNYPSPLPIFVQARGQFGAVAARKSGQSERAPQCYLFSPVFRVHASRSEWRCFPNRSLANSAAEMSIEPNLTDAARPANVNYHPQTVRCGRGRKYQYHKRYPSSSPSGPKCTKAGPIPSQSCNAAQ